MFICNQLGSYESDNEESEVDSDDEYVPHELGAEERAILMPPPNPDDFCELPIRDQFAYVKPIIKAILNETYLPARERHRAFMQGGPSRLRLRKAATGKGDLTARDVSRLGRALQNWVLGPMLLQTVALSPSPPGHLESESGLVSPMRRQMAPLLKVHTKSTQTDIQVVHPDPLVSPNCVRLRSCL
jgi:hypothetical protein